VELADLLTNAYTNTYTNTYIRIHIYTNLETGVELADLLANAYGTRCNDPKLTEARRNKYKMQVKDSRNSGFNSYL
jgi:hypothetical protein